MKGKIKIGVGTLMLFVLFACQKKDTPVPVINNSYSCQSTTYYIDSELQNFKFQVGSYWVYIDSVSLSIDSTYVDGVLHSDFVRSPNMHCTEMVQRYEYRVKKSTAPYYDSILIAAGYNDVKRNSVIFQNTTSSIYVKYNFVSNNEVWSAGDTIYKRDSMFIYDRYYKHVMFISFQTDVNENNLKTIYYANKDYGLLRKDVFNSNGSLKNKFLLKSKNIVR